MKTFHQKNICVLVLTSTAVVARMVVAKITATTEVESFMMESNVKLSCVPFVFRKGVEYRLKTVRQTVTFRNCEVA